METRSRFSWQIASNFGVVRLEKRSLVFGAGGCGVHVIIASAFNVVEERGGFKLERDFVWIKHLENDEFVSGCGEAREMFFQFFRRRKEVRDKHGHSAFSGELSGATERFAKVGFIPSGLRSRASINWRRWPRRWRAGK